MPKRLAQKPKIDVSSLNIGKQIALFRKRQGLTQQDLADKIGIKQALLSDYETGRVRVYVEMFLRISIALGVSPNELLSASTDDQDQLSLRMVRRIQQIENLPEHKKKVILKTIDDLIRANS